MPRLDLPLPELRLYSGRNPKPADFDDYWAKGLLEVQALDPKPEFVPAQFTAKEAECFDLYFTGVGGARIHTKYVRPKKARSCPVVLQFHGYSMNSGDWFEKLAWVAGGFACAALDVRGQGGLSEDNLTVVGSTYRGHITRGLADPDPGKLAFRRIFLDTVQLARVIMNQPEVDSTRIMVWGGSQGGGLALACASLVPEVHRCAAIYPFLCDYQRVWEMDLAKDAYAELDYYFRMFDAEHKAEEQIFTRLGYIDCQHLAPRIKAETTMITSLSDTICPPSTQFAAYNKIQAPKNVIIYPDYSHESISGACDHIFSFFTRQS